MAKTYMNYEKEKLGSLLVFYVKMPRSIFIKGSCNRWSKTNLK